MYIQSGIWLARIHQEQCRLACLPSGAKLERAALHAATGLEQLRGVHGSRSIAVHPQLLLKARGGCRQDDVEASETASRPNARVVVSGADRDGNERFPYGGTCRRNADGEYMTCSSQAARAVSRR
jgi:hypothetical protein